MRYQIRTVDVFSSQALEGNQLAVVLGADDLDAGIMQSLAKEMNISETTFVAAPKKEGQLASLRIFTPRTELPFAGHPTLGTAYVLWSEGLVPPGVVDFTLGEKIGPIAIHVAQPDDDPIFWMTQPPVRFGEVWEERRRVAEALGLAEDDLVPDAPIQAAGVGVPYLYVPLKDAPRVDAADPNPARVSLAFAAGSALPVLLFAIAGERHLYSRMFAGHTIGINEDPATGSAAGALGAFAARYGMVPRRASMTLLDEQGTKMGRRSEILIKLAYSDDSELPHLVEVGGRVVPVIKGEVTLAAGGSEE